MFAHYHVFIISRDFELFAQFFEPFLYDIFAGSCFDSIL